MQRKRRNNAPRFPVSCEETGQSAGAVNGRRRTPEAHRAGKFAQMFDSIDLRQGGIQGISRIAPSGNHQNHGRVFLMMRCVPRSLPSIFSFRRRTGGMRKSLAIFSAAIALGCAVGCDALPRESAGALDQIRASKTLRVGVSENPPWVEFENGKVAGVEADVIEHIADEFGASVHYVRGSETELMKKLHARDIDIVAFGLDTRTPHRKRAALTRPYLETRPTLPESGAGKRSHVLAVSQGESKLLFEIDRILLDNKVEWERLYRRAQR